jgi:hypothetical protein
MQDLTKIAGNLRTLAKELRITSEAKKKEQLDKCAHILIAVHGLNTLKQAILNPEGR